MKFGCKRLGHWQSEKKLAYFSYEFVGWLRFPDGSRKCHIDYNLQTSGFYFFPMAPLPCTSDQEIGNMMATL